MTSGIESLFQPRGIAVIGASHNPEKIGYKILENIIMGGYEGKVYPINPEAKMILGKQAYRSVSEVEEVDLAIISIPANKVFDAVKECADKGVRNAAIITSGFAEVGDIETEKKMVEYASAKGMRILGPNIFGLYVAKSSLNATFGIKNVMNGGIAIITQSGALGISLMGRTAVERVGLSAMFSVGNKSDIDEADLLEYLIEDHETRVVMMYVEGIKRGERLISVLRKASSRKPVIVIKAGRSKRGAVAAASHTGSLAGSDAVFSDIIRQCGVIRAENINEALDWSKYLSDSPKPGGENTVIITNGGGMGVLAADACEKYGINLLDDPKTLTDAFASVVPSFGSLKNPIDLTGQATLDFYRSAINAALASRDIHSIICLGCETAFFDAPKLAETIKDMYAVKKPEKPIVFSFFGGAKIDDCINQLKDGGIPAYAEVYEAVSCMGVLYQDYRNQEYLSEKMRKPEKIAIKDAAIKKVLSKASSEGRGFLMPDEAEKVMSAGGIRMPKGYIAKDLKEAVKYAEKIGYPVVMKIASKDIVHKSEAGGVALDLQNKQEVVDAYQAIMHAAKKYKPDARISGVSVSEMLTRDLELIVGSVRDKSFGPVVMYGLGGVYVEVLGDVSFRSYPLTRGEVLSMINETKSSRLLSGIRGEKRKDIDSVVETILRLGEILRNHHSITDIEINPLMVYEEGKGAKPLDVRILLAKDKVVL